MSYDDDYEQYRRMMQGRTDLATKQWSEYVNAPGYTGATVTQEEKEPENVYQDEQGRKFRFIFGQRVYLEE